eukprot:s1868_g5.t1
MGLHYAWQKVARSAHWSASFIHLHRHKQLEVASTMTVWWAPHRFTSEQVAGAIKVELGALGAGSSSRCQGALRRLRPPPAASQRRTALQAHEAAEHALSLTFMAGASRIDVLRRTRGSTCFAGANLQAAWYEPFMKKNSIENFEDFVYVVPKKKWETGLEQMVDPVTYACKACGACPFQSCHYETGLQAVRAASAASDSLLRLPGTVRHRHRGCPGTIGLHYREFRKQTIIIVEARHIKKSVAIATACRCDVHGPCTSHCAPWPHAWALGGTKAVAVQRP